MKSCIYIGLAIVLISLISCEKHDNRDEYVPSVCGSDSLLSAGDALWSHGEGDLQNTKRAPALRVKGCISGPVDTPHVVWSIALGGAGTASSPVIGDDGTIYIISEYPGVPMIGNDRNTGILAISPQGSLKWFYSIPINVTQIYSASVAIGPDGTIYHSGWDSALYAIRPSGQLKWKKFIGSGPGLYAMSPVVDEKGHIYTASDTIFCFDSGGKILWRYYDDNYPHDVEEITFGKTNVYCGMNRGGILALNRQGQRKWFYPVQFDDYNNFFSIVLDEEENLYFKINSSHLYSLDKYGDYRWDVQSQAGFSNIMQPVVQGDFLYSAVFRSVIKLNRFNPLQITVLDQFLFAFFEQSSSPIIDDEGVVYVATDQRVLGVRSSGEKLWEITLDNMDGTVWGYPALSPDGTLYVAHFGSQSTTYKLYAIK